MVKKNDNPQTRNWKLRDGTEDFRAIEEGKNLELHLEKNKCGNPQKRNLHLQIGANQRAGLKNLPKADSSREENWHRNPAGAHRGTHLVCSAGSTLV